ncbi:MAG: hypothetical protein ACREPY_17555 [Rhodanobacteraceae bacterium]
MGEPPTSNVAAQWTARGVVVLPRFYANEEVDAVRADHYFPESDCRALESRLVPESGGFWIRRSHQPIPGSLNSRVRSRPGRAARRLRGLLTRRGTASRSA